MELYFEDQFEMVEIDRLSTLPAPVLRAIVVRHLDYRDLANLFRCNKNLSKLADDEELWRGLYAAVQTHENFESVVERFLEQLDVTTFWKDTCSAREASYLPPRQFYLSETRGFLREYLWKANIDLLFMCDRSTEMRSSFIRAVESQFYHSFEEERRDSPFRECSDLLGRAAALRGAATISSIATRAPAERIAGPLCSPLPVLLHHGYSHSDLVIHHLHRRGSVMLLCFDVASEQSFTWIQEQIIAEFNLHPTDSDTRCWVLVGLLPPLSRISQQSGSSGGAVPSPRLVQQSPREIVRSVSIDQGKSLAESYDMPYLEISCSFAPVVLSLAVYEFALKRPRPLTNAHQINSLNMKNVSSNSAKNCRAEAAEALQQFVKVRDGLLRLLSGVSAPVPNLKSVAAESRATVAEMKIFYRSQRGRLQDYADKLKQLARELIASVKSALMCRAPAKLNAPGGAEELSNAITRLAQCMNEIRALSLQVICANAIL